MSTMKHELVLTESQGGSPSHPTRPSTGVRRQRAITGFHDNHF